MTLFVIKISYHSKYVDYKELCFFLRLIAADHQKNPKTFFGDLPADRVDLPADLQKKCHLRQHKRGTRDMF